jgi:hypothetical protein
MKILKNNSAGRWFINKKNDGSAGVFFRNFRDTHIAAAAAAGLSPVFYLPLTGSGLGQLDQSLTINGSTVSPTFVYYGADAVGGATWPAVVGDDLASAGAGSPVNSISTPLLDGTLALEMNATLDYWKASTSSFAEINNDDFVFEVVMRTPSTALRRNFCYTTVSANSGWWLRTDGNRFQVLVYDAGGTGQVAQVSNLADNSWIHVMVFGHQGGKLAASVNGGAVGVSAGTLNGSPTNNVPLSNGQGAARQSLAYVAMWQKASWLSTHDNVTIAKERFHKLIGIHPTTGDIASTATRATTAYLDKWNATANRRELFLVEDNWLRTASRRDTTNNKLIKGYLSEEAATNLITHAYDFSNAAWIKSNCSVAATPVTPPNQITTGSLVIHEDAAAATSHNIKLGASVVSGSNYVTSLWAKAINRDWLYLRQNVEASSVSVSFNLSTGVKGTVVDGSGYHVSSDIEDW